MPFELVEQYMKECRKNEVLPSLEELARYKEKFRVIHLNYVEDDKIRQEKLYIKKVAPVPKNQS